MANTSRLYLVGTIHDDLRGEERLLRHLYRLNPDIVTSEGPTESPYDGNCIPEDVIRKQTDEFLAGLHPDILPVQREEIRHLCESWLRAQGFEDRAIEQYAREKGITPHVIESRELWDGVDIGLSSRDLLGGLLPYGTAEAFQRKCVDRTYQIVKECYARGTVPDFLDEAGDARRGFVGSRDSYMAPELRSRVSANPGKVIAHVGGLFHFLDSQERKTMYSQLKDLHPTRVLIAERPGTGIQ